MGKLILQNDPNAALAEAPQFEYNLFKDRIGYSLAKHLFFSLYIQRKHWPDPANYHISK